MTTSFTVRILLFAGLKERVGQAEVSEALPAGSSVADLMERLQGRWPFLADYPLAVARNCEVVDPATSLAAGDEVALLPPVSGG